MAAALAHVSSTVTGPVECIPRVPVAPPAEDHGEAARILILTHVDLAHRSVAIGTLKALSAIRQGLDWSKYPHSDLPGCHNFGHSSYSPLQTLLLTPPLNVAILAAIVLYVGWFYARNLARRLSDHRDRHE